MHTGSRAFCFLMALAATGAECASAAIPAPNVDAGHYRVEVAKDSTSLSTVVVANHVLAIMAVSHAIGFSRETVARQSATSHSVAQAQSFSVLDAGNTFFVPEPVAISRAYDADGRCMASLADANEQQLLFVKITRG